MSVRNIFSPFLFIIVFTGTASLSWGDESTSLLETLGNTPLRVNITANVLNSTGENLWTTEISKITINGRSVKVKISGVNVIVVADITPYLDGKGAILLVSQGEVWIGTSSEDKLQHYATIKSVPVSSGERAFFFPLGVVEGASDMYTIELVIQVFTDTDLR